MARQTGISRSSVICKTKKYLNLKAYKRVIGQTLSENCTIHYLKRENVSFIKPQLWPQTARI